MTNAQIEAALKACEAMRAEPDNTPPVQTGGFTRWHGKAREAFYRATFDPLTGYEAMARELLRCRKALEWADAWIDLENPRLTDLREKINEALAEADGGAE